MKQKMHGTHLLLIDYKLYANVAFIIFKFKTFKLENILDNSCGPINIEYPEFLIKTPALSSSYMQGDVARFECFQSHWIKGDYEYKCSQVVDYNNPYNYRFEWNKGSQPWCRAREIDTFINWLIGILLFIGIITIIILIFLSFWCIKMQRQQERESNRHRGRSPSSRYPQVFIRLL